MTASPFLVIDSPCRKAAQITNRALTGSGLRVMQTFDLKVARHAAKDCSCPNHGTSSCDCQMVVLLVYGSEAQPTSLILHGNRGQTQFSIAEPSNQTLNEKVLQIVKSVLNEKSLFGRSG